MQALGDFADLVGEIEDLNNKQKQEQDEEVRQCIRDAQLEALGEAALCVGGTALTDSEEFLPACLEEVQKGLMAHLTLCAALKNKKQP